MPSLQFGQSLLHYRFLHSISVTNTDSLMNAQPSSSLNPQEKKISDFSLWTLFLLDEIFSTCSYFPQHKCSAVPVSEYGLLPTIRTDAGCYTLVQCLYVNYPLHYSCTSWVLKASLGCLGIADFKTENSYL